MTEDEREGEERLQAHVAQQAVGDLRRTIRGTVVAIVVAAALLWVVTETPVGREWAGVTEPPPVPALSLVPPPQFGDEWHPPLAGKRSLGPAPTLRRGPMMKFRGVLVATWIALGAGDATYNGTYAESGTYNGQPAYTNGSRWLYLIGVNWALGPTLGNAQFAYSSTTDILPANDWLPTEFGTAPGPTLSSFGSPVAGEEDPFGWRWPLNFWLFKGGGSANTNVQPCLATLGSVNYLVIPAISTLDGGWKGFHLCDLTDTAAPTWLTVPMDDDADFIWPLWSASYGQSAAIFDAGDGAHVWAFGQAYLDGSTPKLVFAKYNLLGLEATRVSTVTLQLHTLLVSNPVQIAPNEFRFVIRDNEDGDLGDDMLYCSYYAGDAGYSILQRFTDFELDQPAPVGYTESHVHTATQPGSGDAGIDHRLVLTDADEVFYLRRIPRTASGVPTVIPYRLTATSYTRLEDVIAAPGGWAQTWGQYNYPAGLLFGEFGTSVYSAGAVGWIPGQDASARTPFVEDPAARHWLLNYGDILLACGWGSDYYAESPFVLFAIPATNTIAPNEGVGVGSGEVAVTVHLPVDVVPNEGVGVGSGEVAVSGAVFVLPNEGVGVGSGEVTVSTSYIHEAYGSAGEIQLQSAYPFWKWRHPRPAGYDNFENRKRGGRLTEFRPSWDTPIDETNPLAEYVAFWSWMSNPRPDAPYSIKDASANGDASVVLTPALFAVFVAGAPESPIDFNGRYEETGTGQGIYVNANGAVMTKDVASGSWVITTIDYLTAGALATAPTTYGFTFPAGLTYSNGYDVLDASTWQYLRFSVTDGADYDAWGYYMPGNPGLAPQEGSESIHVFTKYNSDTGLLETDSYQLVWNMLLEEWVLRPTWSYPAADAVATGGSSDQFPWVGDWVGATVTRDDGLWGDEGLELVAGTPPPENLPSGILVPCADDLIGDFTFVVDLKLTREGLSDIDSILSIEFTGTDIPRLLLTGTINGADPSLYLGFVGDTTAGGGEMQVDTWHRIVASLDRSGLGSLYMDGVLLDTVDISYRQYSEGTPNFRMVVGGNKDLGGMFDFGLEFEGVIREVGVLNGYAATADDVATNAAFTTRYGLAAMQRGV